MVSVWIDCLGVFEVEGRGSTVMCLGGTRGNFAVWGDFDERE